jgi:hypothetical protein
MHGICKELAHHNGRILGSSIVCKKNLEFQKTLRRCEKNSLHHDCTVATLPRCFNPVIRYDCYPTHIHELTTKAPNKMFVVHVQKEAAQEEKMEVIQTTDE